jgi:hypothetical protein
MEKSTRNGLIAVGIMAVLGYFAYKKFILPNSKLVVLNYLDASFGGDHSAFANGMKQSYADAWAQALMKGQDTFTDSGLVYWTCGGKAKVNDVRPCN